MIESPIVSKQCAFNSFNTNKTYATIYIMINTILASTSEQTNWNLHCIAL